MKLILALLICTPIFSAPAFVQASNGGSAAAATSKATGATATTAHNTILSFVGINGGVSCVAAPTVSVSDTAGNTYKLLYALFTNTNKCLWAFIAKDITAHATNVVTATATASLANFYLNALEFSGIDPTNPRDASFFNNDQNAATTLTTTPFNTFWADEILVAGAWTSTAGAWTVGSGYTLPSGATSPDNAVTAQYKIVSARQTAVTTSITNASSGPMLIMGVSLIAPVPQGC